MKPKTAVSRSLPRDFAALNALLPLRPIMDAVDLENAVELVDRLAILSRPTKDQSDYLETLTTLIEKYEAENDPLDVASVSPIEVLKMLLEAHGMNASDLGRLLGERSLGSKILSGERELSKSHIRILCERFSLSPAAFL